MLEVIISEEVLYPPVGLLGLFDVSTQFGSGSAAQRTVPKLEGKVKSSYQSLHFTHHPRFLVRKNPDSFSVTVRFSTQHLM